jgi:hypothetical protein
MTPIESTRSNLLVLRLEHENDGDGGYRFAAALCDYRVRMTKDATELWDKVLLKWVHDEEPSLWGVALEALARVGGHDVNGALSAMLGDGERGVEFRDLATNTLIRRRFVIDSVRAEVERGARQLSPMGLANIAAALAFMPDLLESAAECVVDTLSAGALRYPETIVPPFVYAATDSDPGILVRLVEHVLERNQEYGTNFSGMIRDYLSKPFVQKRLGGEIASALDLDQSRLNLDKA